MNQWYVKVSNFWKSLPPAWRNAIFWVTLAFLIFGLGVLAGCSSPTKNITKEAQRVSAAANTTVGHLEAINEISATLIEGPVDVPFVVASIQDHSNSAIALQDTIKKSADAVQLNATQVEDKVSIWATILKWGLIAISIAGVSFLIWYSGVGHLIRKFFLLFGAFIPDAATTQAKLDSEALAKTPDNAALRESVAAKRSTDPAYNAAFKRVHSKSK